MKLLLKPLCILSAHCHWTEETARREYQWNRLCAGKGGGGLGFFKDNFSDKHPLKEGLKERVTPSYKGQLFFIIMQYTQATSFLESYKANSYSTTHLLQTTILSGCLPISTSSLAGLTVIVVPRHNIRSHLAACSWAVVKISSSRLSRKLMILSIRCPLHPYSYDWKGC